MTPGTDSRASGRVLRAAVTLGLGIAPLCMLLTACQTGAPKEPAPGEAVRAGHLIPLVPVSTSAKLHFAEGAYPNLFSGESLAIWLTGHAPRALPGQAEAEQRELPASPSGPAPPEMDMPMMQEHFAVFEVRLTSAFADASIAYDVVGLSGLHVYLLAPTGERILPAQVVMGRELAERQQGALKVFSRTNRITFPRDQMKLVVPANLQAPSLKLVIEGYGNVFYFEWYSQLPAAVGPPPFGQREEVQRSRETLRRARGKALEWSHTFD